MGTGVTSEGEAPDVARTIPTTGMRGGLGRTLLTAFLILAIVPLGLIGSYALQQNRKNLRLEVERKLQTLATLKGEELHLWFENLHTSFRLALSLSQAQTLATSEPARRAWWSDVTAQMPSLRGVEMMDQTGQTVWTLGACSQMIDDQSLSMMASSVVSATSFDSSDRLAEEMTFSIFYPEPNVDEALVAMALPYETEIYIFCMAGERLWNVIGSHCEGVGASNRTFLVYDDCLWAREGICTEPVEDSIIGEHLASDFYVNHADVTVVGAYYPMPALDAGILVEQNQAEIMASSDRMAATFIALVLAGAIATTAISAIVIRQITRPVIQLTESAVAMAEGDLDQSVAVTSRDEIGILTYVFNEMAAELKSLYEDLEAKVAERTQELQRANYQIQRRALHFQASQEVSQAITSIRDPELLLSRVADLIRDHFVYASVAVYLVEPGGGEIRRRALSPMAGEWPERCYAGDGTIVDRAVRHRESRVITKALGGEDELPWHQRLRCQVAVPFRMSVISKFPDLGQEERVLGAMAVSSAGRERIQEDEITVLEILANQVAIALENAEAYERERQAAEQLAEAEAFKSRFLANMSHELREPLNTIIGFSRLMIKGIDGELNKQQLLDLEQIYTDSKHLLLLINDILAISQIQAGLMELKLQPVNLLEVVSGVMPTASALVRGKDIELEQEIADDLPMLRVDPGRFRQILVHLFTNAAKFTEEGKITLRAWYPEGEPDRVYISVSDTGIGIPAEDRDRIFVRFEKGQDPHAIQMAERRRPGAGLGLALSKEFVEMHGGQIWVESEVGKGSTFTFSVPCYRASDSEMD
jgi:signal transduction histidine kinase/HAMP domain-containing protein